LVAFLAGSAFGGSPDPAAIDNGIIGRWQATPQLADTVGKCPGKANEGVSIVQGRSGAALAFDGKKGCVTLERTDLLASRRAFTLAAWVRHEGAGMLLMQGGYCENVASVRRGRTFWLHVADDGRIQANVQGNRGYFDDPFNRIESYGRLARDTWQHVAVVFDSGDVSIYIDGSRKSVVEKSLVSVTPASTDLIRIGCGCTYEFNPLGDTSNHWKGQLEDLRLWDRALGDREIVQSAGLTTSAPGTYRGLQE
jgi:hypothetical protein